MSSNNNMNSDFKAVPTGFPRRSGYGRTAKRSGAIMMTGIVPIAKREINLASWNVQSLLREGDEELLGLSLRRYNIDVACLQEVRYSDSGSVDIHVPLQEDGEDGTISLKLYKLFYSGRKKDEPQGQSGVGFAVRTEFAGGAVHEPISDRLSVLTLRGVPKDIVIVNAYAPTNKAPAAEKDAFYEALADRMANLPNNAMVFVCGDFNAKLGHVDEAERVAFGPYTRGNRCDNGDRLVQFALMHRLFATNTGFKRPPHQLATWQSCGKGRYRVRNQIDYILVQRWWRTSVRNVRTRWHQLDISSDHAMLVARVRLKLKVDRGARQPPRFDDNLLKANAIRDQFGTER